MGLNYVENRGGRRVIRWGNLGAFLVAAPLVPAAAGGAFARLVTGGDAAAAARHGALFGLAVFVAAVVCSLRMPIARLPRGV
jgi:hypothetical protein